jgi:hypothetical protein
MDESELVVWLKLRPSRLGALQDAVQGACDAITVDDATVAAKHAALAARSFGHDVTLFVNPYHVQSGTYYFFARLNAALDATTRTSIEWRGVTYRLHIPFGKLKYRAAVKRELRLLCSESDRDILVRECLAALGTPAIDPPEYLHTLDEDELRQLKEAGVTIQNHGWTHGEVGAADTVGVDAEISKGRQWLAETLAIQADYYAVPFGDTLPPAGCRNQWRTWFLLASEKPLEWVSGGVYNRKELPERG